MNGAARDFASGPFTFRLDAGTGFVRDIRHRGHEVLRGIYPAVRDEQWGTLPPLAAPPVVTAGPSVLSIVVAAHVQAAAANLEWTAEIAVEADGRLTYRWRGRALRAFRTCRTGLCVLHPASAAGALCRVEHTDRRVTVSALPSAIAPHQPFKEIRAVTHDYVPGASATVQLEGETFEMEDQRNWTDASFKTYCRPLDWPRPYEIKAGDEIVHTVTLSLTGSPAPASTAPSAPVWTDSLALPRLGFALPGPVPATLLERARALRPAHVRVATTAAGLDTSLAWAAPAAADLGCELELAVRGATTAAPDASRFPVGSTVLLFDRDGLAVADSIVAAWRAAGHRAVGTGTDRHFTELNRHRPPANGAHTLVAFGIDAQVHAFDDESIFETLTQHAVVARQARAIGGGRPVAVGPIVLGPGPEADDARLRTEFAARWTRASLAALAEAGVARATYFNLHGRGGILRASGPTPLEEFFLSLAAQPVPVA